MVGIWARLKLIFRLGFFRVCLYALHRTRLKVGYYAFAHPVTEWDWKQRLGFTRNIFAVSVRSQVSSDEHLTEQAEKILCGKWCFFSRHWLELPPSWLTHPQSGVSAKRIHWSRLSDFDPRMGDVKWLWESSRFDGLHVLVRAWRSTGQAIYLERFWHLFNSWCDENPPNLGPHWKCGQECALRAFVLLWVLGALEGPGVSRSDRKRIYVVLAKLAVRIEATLGYALSQNNNHGLSEAAALYLIGLSIPNHPRASRWRRKGDRLFRKQFLEQFFPDGAYIQHSFVYQRLAMRVSLLFLMGKLKETGHIPTDLMERLSRAVQFLSQLMDAQSGQLPNYGANDGANLLSLSSADYTDFRPLLNTIVYALRRERIFSSSECDEELRWYFGDEALLARIIPVSTGNLAAQESGYYTLRNSRGFIFTRCHSFQTRPGHADGLHVDWWYRGQNLLLDLGTYSYFDSENQHENFRSTAMHNTVTVDGRSQMPSIGRFLWADWLKSQVDERSLGAQPLQLFQGRHFGYFQKLGVIHVRTILMKSENWLIVDDILAPQGRQYPISLAWHLDARFEFGDNRLQAYHADTGARFTFWHSNVGSSANITRMRSLSRYYGSVEEMQRWVFRETACGNTRWVTALGDSIPSAHENFLAWQHESIPLTSDPENLRRVHAAPYRKPNNNLVEGPSLA